MWIGSNLKQEHIDLSLAEWYFLSNVLSVASLITEKTCHSKPMLFHWVTDLQVTLELWKRS
jgi:hypothetical protein